jgi:hypothetical protein
MQTKTKKILTTLLSILVPVFVVSGITLAVTTIGTNITTQGDLTVDTDTLYVDSVNNRVGIGTTGPGKKLEIRDNNYYQLKLSYDTSNYVDLGADACGELQVSPSGFQIYFPTTSIRIYGEEGGAFYQNVDGEIIAGYNGSLYNYAEGNLIVKSGNVGIGTTSPEFKLSLNNDGAIIAKGTYGSGDTLSTSGAGTRLIWYPKKAAFRTGYVSGTQWDNNNIGDYSMAGGYDSNASGAKSVAFGYSTVASGESSIALGYLSGAYGFNSAAIGSAFAEGIYSLALGRQSYAQGEKSIAIGPDDAWAAGDKSIAIGNEAYSEGYQSVAFGSDTHSAGQNSMAIGQVVKSTGQNSITIGHGTGSTKLDNTVADSLAIGFNSNIPTLFVGPSSGTGTTGNVGIGTTSPVSKLQVDGYIQMDMNNGAPAAGDCDSNTERGRTIMDYSNNRVYICNGATRGWDYVNLSD